RASHAVVRANADARRARGARRAAHAARAAVGFVAVHVLTRAAATRRGAGAAPTHARRAILIGGTGPAAHAAVVLVSSEVEAGPVAVGEARCAAPGGAGAVRADLRARTRPAAHAAVRSVGRNTGSAALDEAARTRAGAVVAILIGATRRAACGSSAATARRIGA